jgi:hypothetical protein
MRGDRRIQRLTGGIGVRWECKVVQSCGIYFNRRCRCADREYMLQAMIILLGVAISGAFLVALGQYRILKRIPIRVRSDLSRW